MGIKGLLPTLSPLLRRVDLRGARGQVVGIDGHVWLHRAVFVDVEASSFGEATSAHVRYFSTRAKRLRDAGLKPVFIFDGDDLPAKSITDQRRMSHRATSLARAISLKDLGSFIHAHEHLAKAADVSHRMVRSIMHALREDGFEVYIAPYEADAQLTYMANSGELDFVITEDSDLAVYGCPRIVFKFDPISMTGFELAHPINDAPAFKDMSGRACILACVLAGCDYGPRLHGIGLVRASRLAPRLEKAWANERDITDIIEESLASTPIPNTEALDIVNHIRLAALVFRHQTVFNPSGSTMDHLNSEKSHVMTQDELFYIGPKYDDSLAEGVYQGTLSPLSKSTYELDNSFKS
jgi:exonuclease-1